MLSGRVVVVTGAGRGIGREVALLCAKQGASVVVNDLGASTSGQGTDASPAAAVVSEILEAGGKAVANVASVSDPAGAQSIIDDALHIFGRIDGVVNNAGVVRDKIFHQMDEQDWRDVIDVNLNGYFHVSRAAAPHFKHQGSGSFVHFTSTSGLIGNFGQANYSAAKLGVVGLSNSIALDMGRYGVRSNCIAPFAWSRLASTIPSTPENSARIRRMKLMSPAKVAPLVTALLSDDALTVTGQVFGVRRNEIFLFSPMRPIKSLHRSGGWTPQSILSSLFPPMRPAMQPLLRSTDLWPYDPV